MLYPDASRRSSQIPSPCPARFGALFSTPGRYVLVQLSCPPYPTSPGEGLPGGLIWGAREAGLSARTDMSKTPNRWQVKPAYFCRFQVSKCFASLAKNKYSCEISTGLLGSKKGKTFTNKKWIIVHLHHQLIYNKTTRVFLVNVLTPFPSQF